jgi:hypothetical protein
MSAPDWVAQTRGSSGQSLPGHILCCQTGNLTTNAPGRLVFYSFSLVRSEQRHQLAAQAPAKEVLLKRTATSARDLEPVEVMGRVAQEGLKLVDAAVMKVPPLSR